MTDTYRKSYYQRHKEHILARCKEYYQANKEKISAYYKKYYSQNNAYIQWARSRKGNQRQFISKEYFYQIYQKEIDQINNGQKKIVEEIWVRFN
jgi:hypothetical protein